MTLDGAPIAGTGVLGISAGEHLITVSSPVVLHVTGDKDADATSPEPGEASHD